MNDILQYFYQFYDRLNNWVGELLPWLEKREYRDYVIAGASILVIFILYKIFLGNRGNRDFVLPPPGKQLFPREKKKFRRIAEKLVEEGEWIKAGDIFRIIGEVARAVDMYKRAGKTLMAAQLAADFDMHETAATLFENAGKFFEAAEEWEKAGNPEKAAEDYLKEKSFIKAAEVLDRAGLYDRAGQIYYEGGYLDKAAQEFIKAKNHAKAAAVLVKLYFNEKKSLEASQNVNPSKLKDLKKLALKCANYLELAGEYKKAMEMYEEGGNYNKAAELAGVLEMWERAAEYYHLGGLPLKAAEIYERLGDKKRAALIRAEVYEKEGNELSAAENYIQSGDLMAAAEIFKKHGKYVKAAALYEKIGDFAMAADMYANSGEFSKAAANYEKAGDYLAAAEMYKRANNTTKLVEMLVKGNRISQAVSVAVKKGVVDEAARLLEKLPRNSSEFVEGMNFILKAFLERNEWDKVKKLLKKYPDIKVTRANLEVMYTIARKFEEEKNFDKAYEIYRKFVERNLLFKDVKQKYELLKAKLETAKMNATKSQQQKQKEEQSASLGGKRRRYQILKELGRGGMGVVYQAHDTVLDRIVAMKVLPLSLRLNPKAVENFKSEAKKAAALNHPNIVTVYDYGEEDGEYFLVMEYVDGITLKDYIRRKGRLSLKEILFIGVNVAKGLAYAHKSNLLHRDIKPSNIMISIQDNERRIKITDFGLAKAWQDSTQHHTMIVGTPYYMAPEQFLGEKVDERTDIYSFGVTLYEMATGEVPFRKGEIGYHHVHTPPPPLREKVPDINPKLEELIIKCLEKEPEKRYQSMQEVLEAFKNVRVGMK